MTAPRFIRLQYKPTIRSRAWRNASLTMHYEGGANMATTARALREQEGWYTWRIVDDETGAVVHG